MPAPVEILLAMVSASAELREPQPANAEPSAVAFDDWFSRASDEGEDDEEIFVAVDALPLQQDVFQREPFQREIGAPRERGDDAIAPAFDVASLDITSYVGRSRARPAPVSETQAPKVASVPEWMQSTIAQARSAQHGKALEVSITHPLHGEVSINVVREDGAMTVHITGPSDASLTALRSELGDLHSSFAAAGLRLKSIQLAVRAQKRGKRNKDSQ
jgi:flagellar hook-length control protein FliK